jgi:hypothetical protein
VQWSFLMNGFHLAITVAIIITASLASNLLAIVTIGPARTRTSAFLRLPLGVRRAPRHIKRLVDSRVAAMLVRREQQAATWARHHLCGRKPREASSRAIRIKSGRTR